MGRHRSAIDLIELILFLPTLSILLHDVYSTYLSGNRYAWPTPELHFPVGTVPAWQLDAAEIPSWQLLAGFVPGLHTP
jgi:hypothetical protein